VKRLFLAAIVAVALAGCGSNTSGAGRATVWVTRDRGTHVLHVARVPAGTSAMQALDRVAAVKARYGGRYVRAVDGLEEHGNRAWFYYVNGYLADRSAAEYRLRPGDVEWWDYRAWRDPAQDPVVVGAFPQPFLSGYDGKRRPAVVVSSDPLARAVARRLRARVLPAGTKAALNANAVVLGADETRITLRGSSPGSPVRLTFSGDPRVLLRRWPFRFRYEDGP
jgi:Domain of unknown function (DUF4430)